MQAWRGVVLMCMHNGVCAGRGAAAVWGEGGVWGGSEGVRVVEERVGVGMRGQDRQGEQVW